MELVKWNIKPDMIQHWKPNNEACSQAENKSDCVYNPMAFLKVLPANIAQQMSRLVDSKAHHSGKGMSDSVFYALVRDTFMAHTEEKYELVLSETGLSLEPAKGLGPSEGTFLWLQRKERTAQTQLPGHAVVLAKDSNGAEWILDPQQMTAHPLHEYRKRVFSNTSDPIVSAKFLYRRPNKQTKKRTRTEIARFLPRASPRSVRRRTLKAAHLPKPHFNKSDLSMCPSKTEPLKSDELCVLILSHGGYATPGERQMGLVEDYAKQSRKDVSFSKHPILNHTDSESNVDSPVEGTFAVPENMVLYQYAQAEHLLTVPQVQHVLNHLGTGKCIVDSIPTMVFVYEKDGKSMSRSKSRSPGKVLLYAQTYPTVTLPTHKTTDLSLTFDKSIPGIEMGYVLYNERQGVVHFPFDLTYTCLRNVLYDLSAKYPDKKLIVHQLSCRSGDYSGLHKKFREKITSLRKTHKSYPDSLHKWFGTPGKPVYGSPSKKQQEKIDAEVEELTRYFGTINIRREGSMRRFSLEEVDRLTKRGYRYTGYYPTENT